jgi:hypothetical protein
MFSDIFCVSAPVCAFTCGATDCIEKTSGVRTVGGLAAPEGGGAGGFGDDAGVAEDCVEPEDVFDDDLPEVGVELLLELDDGELALCVVEEPPVVEPELVVDVCAKA